MQSLLRYRERETEKNSSSENVTLSNGRISEDNDEEEKHINQRTRVKSNTESSSMLKSSISFVGDKFAQLKGYLNLHKQKKMYIRIDNHLIFIFI